MKTKEVIYPERIAKLIEVSNIRTFKTRDTSILYGIEAVVDNGDSFSHWSPDKQAIEFFKVGTYLIYKLKKSIENPTTEHEVVKTKLDSYDFILPRKTRAEVDIVKNITESINISVSQASSIVASNPEFWLKSDKKTLSKAAEIIAELSSIIHGTRKNMLNGESYGESF